MQTLTQHQLTQCQLDKDQQNVVAGAARGVQMHRHIHTVVLHTLPYRHHSLFSLYQMAMVLWCLPCLILLQETPLFVAAIGTLDRLVLGLKHTK